MHTLALFSCAGLWRPLTAVRAIFRQVVVSIRESYDEVFRVLSIFVSLSLSTFFLISLQVNGRIISKQIHVRVEHVSPSKCRDEMKRRVKENEAAKKAAREGGG